jgi:integrase
VSVQKNARGVYEAMLSDRSAGRVHVSLKTKANRDAGRRHAALEALVRQYAHAPAREVLRLLRARKLTIQAVTACHEAGRPFDSLVAGQAWPTLGAAVDQYLAWLKTHPKKAGSTHAGAVSKLAVWRDALGADRPVDAVPLADVEAERQALAGRHVEGTVGQYLIRLSALYTWLAEREDFQARLEKRPARALHVPIDRTVIPSDGDLRGKRVRFLSAEEAVRLLAATPPEMAAPVALGLLAGLRLDETCHLTREDVDLELGLVSVRPKASPDVPKEKGGAWKPKSKYSVRDVPLEPQLPALLRRHLGAWAADRWVLPAPSDASHPRHRNRLGVAFKAIAKDAGFVTKARDPEGVTYHTLRHTFASWLVMEGVDLFTVSQLLGHANTTEVVKTYAHLSPLHKATAVAKIGRRFTLPDAGVTP